MELLLVIDVTVYTAKACTAPGAVYTTEACTSVDVYTAGA
jgi:hypothetical protein